MVMPLIKVKLKTCHKCGKQSKLFHSKPPTCYSCARASFTPIKATKAKSPTKASRDKEKLLYKRKMAGFLEDMTNYIPTHCMNCNQPFGYIPPWRRKWVCAHILPKKEGCFESVAFDPDNILYLCTINGCHGNWDNKGKDDRRKMPVYTLAIERIEKLYDKLTDHEQVLLTKYI